MVHNCQRFHLFLLVQIGTSLNTKPRVKILKHFLSKNYNKNTYKVFPLKLS